MAIKEIREKDILEPSLETLGIAPYKAKKNRRIYGG